MSFGKYMRNSLDEGAAVALAWFDALMVKPELWEFAPLGGPFQFLSPYCHGFDGDL